MTMAYAAHNEAARRIHAERPLTHLPEYGRRQAVADRTCSIDRCDRLMRYPGYGLCAVHYVRLKKHGTTDDPPRSPETCTIDGCDRPYLARGWCAGHYSRWRDNGDPGVSELRERNGDPPEGCTYSGCGEPHMAKGFCVNHYAMWRKHGNPGIKDRPPGWKGVRGEAHPAWRGEDISYDAAHSRLYRTCGAANEHDCVDCGSQAYDWSYDYQDPNQRRDPKQGFYSGKVGHYVPRCRSCHRRYDIKNKPGDKP